MFRRIFAIIPVVFRSRAYLLAINIMLRAVLNFFGVALLVPLMMLILDQNALLSNYWLSRVYDYFGGGDYREFALILVGIIIVAMVLKNAINLLLYRYERDFVYDLYKTLSRRLYINYFNQGLRFIRQNNSVELSRRVNLVTLNFVVGILRSIAVLAGESTLLMLIVVALVIYNGVAVICVMLILVPIIWAYYRFIRRRMIQNGRAENESHRIRLKSVTDSFRGYADVEVNNAFGRMLSEFDNNTSKLVDIQRRNAMLSTLPSTFMEIAVLVGMALLVVVGLYSPTADIKILFGVFAVAILRLMPSLRSMLSACISISHNRYTLDLLSDIGYSDDVEQTSERLPLGSMIELRNLGFTYGNEAVIRNLNMTIKRGDKVGIQGASGCGKSTLINLLLGLIEPCSGEILIDGDPLGAINRRRWQNSVGYVPQNLFLLDASLKENIAFGVEEKDIDLKRLHRVITMASLEDLVASLPEGVDSRVGELGCCLSGGERQRIGIARALYRDPDVLFLDEATSALDLETERQINLSIQRLIEQNPKLTIIVVSHRKSSLDYCDYLINL